MRTKIAFLVVITLSSFAVAEVFAQCQRGGGGRNPQQGSFSPQIAGFNQVGVPRGFRQAGGNPQQGAMQQAFMQQQIAARQVQMRQQAFRAQARGAQLTRRRSSAQQRRAAELARREEIRAANFAKLKALESQETLVSLTSD